MSERADYTDLASLIESVDELKAEINALRPIDAAQEKRIMQKLRLDWNYHSNAIEGNTLSLGETRALILHGLTAKGKPLKDHLDIEGHNEAVNYLIDFVRQEAVLTEAVIREIHKILLKEPYYMEAQTPEGQLTRRLVQIGQYKSMPNHVVTSTGEMHYYATPQETPARMEELMAWYRKEAEKKELHPLILAATFHYRFVSIHPFDDGNGRMARILMNLILMQRGYVPAIVRNESRNEYLLALEQADAGDLEPFILLLGNQLLHSLDLFLRGAKGESIEELDDLDKKIALLKRQLDSYEAKEGRKTIQSQSEIFNRLIEPLFRALHTRLTQVNELFQRSTISLIYHHKGHPKLAGNRKSFEAQLREVAEVLQENEDIYRISFSYRLYGFRKDSTQDAILILEAYLGNDKVEITYHGTGRSKRSLIRSSYNQDFTSDEINKMAYSILESFLRAIEAWMRK